MRFRLAILTKTIHSTLNFEQLALELKESIGVSYKMGEIDRKSIHLYYFKDKLGLDRIPPCEIQVLNKKDDLPVDITFGLATHFIVFGYFWPVLFTIIFLFNDILSDAYPFVIFIFALVTIAMFAAFNDQSGKFENDIKTLESKYAP